MPKKTNITTALQQLIHASILNLDPDVDLKPEDIHLEHPTAEAHGDYSTNVAMVLFGNTEFRNQHPKYKSPRELAQVIIDELQKLQPTSYNLQPVPAGPGFINFFLKEGFLIKQMQTILEMNEAFGKNDRKKDKKIIVEFAHPNTHKQFHIGHLRNISLGESIVRILEANGARIIRANYQGDVGMHIAKALWGIREQLRQDGQTLENITILPIIDRIVYLGKTYALGATHYEENEAAKQEMIAINKSIYNQDNPDITELWQLTRQWSLDYFDSIYERVDTHYDRLFFESEVHKSGLATAKKALSQGILEESEGAIVFKGDQYGLDTRVFITREGTPTYEAKELGLAPLEFSEFGLIDKCIHVVGPEQKSFFEVTFKVEELLDPKAFQDKQYHLVYGFVDLKTGKMSSRKGKVLTGMSVVEEAKRKIIKKKMFRNSLPTINDKEIDEIAEKIAVGAVKYSLLKQGTEKNIAFDIEESISLEGNSGPYLQYTYARAKSVLGKAELDLERDLSVTSFLQDDPYDLNNEELTVLRYLYRFPEVVELAAKEYAPNHICTYLYELAQRYNSFYNKHSILQSATQETKHLRLMLTQATAQVIKNGLTLLGIQAPEKM